MDASFKLTRIKENFTVKDGDVTCNTIYKIKVGGFTGIEELAVEERLFKILKNYKKCSHSLVFDVTAIAHCSEQDNWSEEIGKKVASSKGCATAYKIFQMVLDDYSDSLKMQLDSVDDTSDYCQTIIDQEADYLNKF